ncbi:MAG: hypothetical protein IJX14_11775, partial [Clostridia bacterium]|nr:hypothetical protein [Clostridia bacterium]
MCTNASDIFTEVQETIIYTPAEQAIYDKVNELAEAKVILNQYRNVNGLTKEDICDNPYINTLLHNID